MWGQGVRRLAGRIYICDDMAVLFILVVSLSRVVMCVNVWGSLTRISQIMRETGGAARTRT